MDTDLNKSITTTILYPTSDAFISFKKDSENLNFGNYPTLYLSNTPSKHNLGCVHKSLLYFDLSSIPANATITSAKLSLLLFRIVTDLALPTISIKQLDEDFYEYNVTSVNSPKSSPINLEDIDKKTLLSTNVNEFISFNNLTKTVSAWYNNESSNHGFELSIENCSVDTFLSFWSRECMEATLRPTLKVGYTISTDITPIETSTIEYNLQPLETGTRTPLHDISKDLFFNYFVTNNGQDVITATVLNFKNSSDKSFNIANNPVTINKSESCIIEVAQANKYICLSISGSNFTKNDLVKIFATSKTFSHMISSTVSSAKVLDDGITILLTMTKPLIGSTADINSFTINNIIDNKSIHTFSKITVQSTTVTLILTKESAVTKADVLQLNYTASGFTNLTGLNGDVDDFINLNLMPPPTVTSGTVDETGYVINLTMSSLLYTKNIETAQFTISDSNKSIESISSIDSSVKINLSLGFSPPILKDEAINLTYNPDFNSAHLSGPTGTVAPFTKTLENNSTIELSKVQTAMLSSDKSSIILTMTTPLIGSYANSTLFSIKNSESIVNSADVDATTVTLTLNPPISEPNIFLSYASKFEDGLRSSAGPVASFTDIEVKFN